MRGGIQEASLKNKERKKKVVGEGVGGACDKERKRGNVRRRRRGEIRRREGKGRELKERRSETSGRARNGKVECEGD